MQLNLVGAATATVVDIFKGNLPGVAPDPVAPIRNGSMSSPLQTWDHVHTCDFRTGPAALTADAAGNYTSGSLVATADENPAVWKATFYVANNQHAPNAAGEPNQDLGCVSPGICWGNNRTCIGGTAIPNTPCDCPTLIDPITGLLTTSCTGATACTGGGVCVGPGAFCFNDLGCAFKNKTDHDDCLNLSQAAGTIDNSPTSGRFGCPPLGSKLKVKSKEQEGVRALGPTGT